MVIDELGNWRRYLPSTLFRRAFEALESEGLRELPDGRHELEGDRIIAIVQSYMTRPADQGRWEAHRKYIDIQYIAYGVETMGWAPVTTLDPEGAFDQGQDVGFYLGTGDTVIVRAGYFAVFFPQDAHMPCLQTGGKQRHVRKIVVKVVVER